MGILKFLSERKHNPIYSLKGIHRLYVEDHFTYGPKSRAIRRS